ncbi:MAG: hypothetical protein L6Q98_00010 [Anaerolineae bacterium]|nr:hypothetical protein [Anaerolineae bacterium]NUQ04934.1 hypothetical protein [Anaerolineae bacterium]
MGIVLIVAAVVALVAWVILPMMPFTQDNRTIDGWFQPLFCGADETFSREQYRFVGPRITDRFGVRAACINSQSEARDVSGPWTLLTIGAAGVPFVIGVLLLIVGFSGSKATVPIVLPGETGPGETYNERVEALYAKLKSGKITQQEYNQRLNEIYKALK